MIYFIKKRKILTLIVLILLASGIFYWRNSSSGSQKTTYQTSKVEKGTIISTVSASGQITNSGKLDIATQVSGVVKSVNVKIGDKVRAGQTIAQITPDQSSAQVKEI
ncbi:MAG: biotin/lipoyl-binding protein [bacterium]|nr:biotin/lipoyl-binding protein [bacterium]